MSSNLRVVYMTREYPPDVYGGAGVHVEYLAREMSRLASVEVRCFGDRPSESGNPAVRRYANRHPTPEQNPRRVRPALQALATCAAFNDEPIEADIVHCHTWYSHWGGVLAKLAYGLPLVVTVHSLEPLRPWKREQLGRGYDVSTRIERLALESADAVIAVSEPERLRILSLFDLDPARVRTIPNGVDTDSYRPVRETAVLHDHGIAADSPYVLFLGRLSRQKGVAHFLAASRRLPQEVQVVLCASAPDAPAILEEVERAVAGLEAEGRRVIWIRDMVPREHAVQLYSHAAVFCCPSVYEPFGLINLEAMACETPVVATAIGGIPEVVVDGETGVLVELEPLSANDPEPAHPDRLAENLASEITKLLRDDPRRREMGRRGRERAVREFGWARVASRVLELYREVARPGNTRVTVEES